MKIYAILSDLMLHRSDVTFSRNVRATRTTSIVIEFFLGIGIFLLLDFKWIFDHFTITLNSFFWTERKVLNFQNYYFGRSKNWEKTVIRHHKGLLHLTILVHWETFWYNKSGLQLLRPNILYATYIFSFEISQNLQECNNDKT